jgi:hypothetical protein
MTTVVDAPNSASSKRKENESFPPLAADDKWPYHPATAFVLCVGCSKNDNDSMIRPVKTRCFCTKCMSEHVEQAEGAVPDQHGRVRGVCNNAAATCNGSDQVLRYASLCGACRKPATAVLPSVRNMAKGDRCVTCDGQEPYGFFVEFGTRTTGFHLTSECFPLSTDSASPVAKFVDLAAIRQFLGPELDRMLPRVDWKVFNVTETPGLVQKMKKTFESKGGQVYLTAAAVKTFTILPTDHLYPVCMQGSNRSQVLYALLENLAHEKKWDVTKTLHLPHGSETGNDPFRAYKDLTDDNWVGYLCDGPVDLDRTNELYRCFQLAFGRPKRPKIGQAQALAMQLNLDDEAKMPLTDLAANRQLMRTLFDHHYYHGGQAFPGRRVFFCFGRAVSRVLERLLEVYEKDSCQGIVIVGMPFDDLASEEQKLARKRMADETASSSKQPIPSPLPPPPAAAASPVGEVTREMRISAAYRKMYEEYARYIG